MSPFKQGEKAFLSGEINNPYPVDTTEHREWQCGFDKQYFKNLEGVESGTGSEEVYRSQASPSEEIN